MNNENQLEDEESSKKDKLTRILIVLAILIAMLIAGGLGYIVKEQLHKAPAPVAETKVATPASKASVTEPVKDDHLTALEQQFAEVVKQSADAKKAFEAEKAKATEELAATKAAADAKSAADAKALQDQVEATKAKDAELAKIKAEAEAKAKADAEKPVAVEEQKVIILQSSQPAGTQPRNRRDPRGLWAFIVKTSQADNRDNQKALGSEAREVMVDRAAAFQAALDGKKLTPEQENAVKVCSDNFARRGKKEEAEDAAAALDARSVPSVRRNL